MKDSKSSKRDSELESLLHSEQRVTVEKMAVGGSGIGRIQFNGKPVVVFIPYSAPEDELTVKISQVEKNFLIGEIIQIHQKSPHRTDPLCEYFGKCGGCLWQHLKLDSQIAQKELILTDLFKKFLPDVTYSLKPTIQGEQPFHYRNRIQLKQIGSTIGYFKHESHEIVPIQNCQIAEKSLQNLIKDFSTKVKPSKELKKWELKISQNDQVEYYPVGERGEGIAFSQVNRSVNELLVKQVVKLTQQIQPKEITELYAGAGNFTFPIAKELPQASITAVELGGSLTASAVETMKSLKLHKQITFFTTSCENYSNSTKPVSKDFVLLDPPRSGCHADVIRRLATENPEAILYISCHPVSLVRDIKPLMTNYTIEHLQIFDMFPQTDHFETVCLLKSK